MCETAPLFTIGTFSNLIYVVTFPAESSLAFDAFTTNPIYCPVPGYSFEITPPIADPNVLILNPDRTFTAQTNDESLIGVYSV